MEWPACEAVSHHRVNKLKKCYGKLPAAVELLSRAGAIVSVNYAGLMRGDVAVPDLSEEKWIL